MATPPSDDTRTLFKLLMDGDWHLYSKIREELAQTVPPGRALRKYDERYKANRKGNGQVDSPLSVDDQILYGARACAQITITSWKGRGIQQRLTDAGKEIRVDPNYKGWGVMLPARNTGGDENAEGVPEVPRSDSVASESSPARPQDPSAPPAVVAAPVGRAAVVTASAPEPVVEAVVEPTKPSPTVNNASGPACEECGLLISDQGRHDAWHLRRAKEMQRSCPPPLDRDVLVTLMGDVVRQELDHFQKGMQGWLMQQFTQLALVVGASQPIPSWLSAPPAKGIHREK